LARRLGVTDAVVIGLGSMIGAGVFAAFEPAARAAGSGLVIGLVVAAVVAYCNATSSARLAALYPESGGTYVYGRRRLGDFWGYQAGWAFVVGKTASCAAMALTFGAYAAPAHARLVGGLAVVALTAVNYRGVQRSVGLTRVIVTLTLLTLAVVVVASLAGGQAGVHHLTPFPGTGVRGVLQAAGLLFFAFAGYARIATLGEEVLDPARTIPRAVTIALLITLVVYAVVAVSALLAAGPAGLAATSAPLGPPSRSGGCTPWPPWCRSGAPSPRSARCWPSSSASRAPPWPWPGTATCPDGWPPCTRATTSRTAPNWPSARSWSSWSPPSTSAERSASPPSASWPTTRSPTHVR
jgi:APA family basic amino acid/polyamine antiporter